MEADAYLPDGTPLHFKTGRASGKSTLQVELYMSLMSGLPIEEVRAAINNDEEEIERRKMSLCDDMMETHRRLMEEPVFTGPLRFYTAGTGIPDDMAIDYFKDQCVVVVDRNFKEWMYGKQVTE